MINNGYSAGTLRAFHTKLSAIFNYAVRFYGLSNNPAKICGTMGTVQGANMDIWTTDQLERAAATIREPEIKVLLELLFWTGLRIGEALALLWGDLEDNVLHITKTKDEKHRITTPKTQSSVRDVILPDSIVQMLMDYKQHCVVTDADAVIFPVTHKIVRNRIKKSAQAAGVPAIRIHDLRHSHASLLIEMGCSPVLIAERLGHQNATVTLQIYAHLYPNKHEAVAMDLDKIRNYGQNLDNSESVV